MSSALLPRRRGATTLAGAAALLLLTGCGSGLKAQTYQEKAAADASNVAIGDLAIRNVYVTAPTNATTYPQGGDAPVTLVVVNEGGQPDVLVQATTDAARSVDVVGGPTPRLQVPALQTADAGYSLVLRGLTRPLVTTEYVDLTLSFERNGTKTLSVPVATTGAAPAGDGEPYEVAEADSEGNPIVKQTTGAESGG